MIGEVGILRLCGWFALILEWIVIVVPNLLLFCFGLAFLGAISAIPLLIADAIASFRRKWYDAMERIAKNIDQEEFHEHNEP